MPFKNIEDARAWRRQWKKTPKGKLARKRYRAGEKGKAAHIRHFKTYAQKHPDKVYARTVVNNAIALGFMTKKPCVICGEKAEAHHMDYSKPLDITWLCHSHHIEEHQKAGDI